jgi:hypothetical protein
VQVDFWRCGSWRGCWEAIRHLWDIAIELGDDVRPIAHRSLFTDGQSGEGRIQAFGADGNGVHGATLAG